MRLRLARTDETTQQPQAKPEDAIPFPQALPCPWQPRTVFDPASQSFDSIANAESALEHVERQMMNIRSLLGMSGGDDGRAA